MKTIRLVLSPPNIEEDISIHMLLLIFSSHLVYKRHYGYLDFMTSFQHSRDISHGNRSYKDFSLTLYGERLRLMSEYCSLGRDTDQIDCRMGMTTRRYL